VKRDKYKKILEEHYWQRYYNNEYTPAADLGAWNAKGNQ